MTQDTYVRLQYSPDQRLFYFAAISDRPAPDWYILKEKISERLAVQFTDKAYNILAEDDDYYSGEDMNSIFLEWLVEEIDFDPGTPTDTIQFYQLAYNAENGLFLATAPGTRLHSATWEIIAHRAHTDYIIAFTRLIHSECPDPDIFPAFSWQVRQQYTLFMKEMERIEAALHLAPDLRFPDTDYFELDKIIL